MDIKYWLVTCRVTGSKRYVKAFDAKEAFKNSYVVLWCDFFEDNFGVCKPYICVVETNKETCELNGYAVIYSRKEWKQELYENVRPLPRV